MAGFQVLVDNSKKSRILQEEGVCPCCGSHNTGYSENQVLYKGLPRKQFVYKCTDCKSLWQGNIYDNMLNLV